MLHKRHAFFVFIYAEILPTLQFYHLIIQVNLVSDAKHSKMSRRHASLMPIFEFYI